MCLIRLFTPLKVEKVQPLQLMQDNPFSSGYVKKMLDKYKQSCL